MPSKLDINTRQTSCSESTDSRFICVMLITHCILNK